MEIKILLKPQIDLTSVTEYYVQVKWEMFLNIVGCMFSKSA